MIRNGTGQISFQLMKSLGFQSNTYRNEALGDYLTLRGYVQERFFCLKRISPSQHWSTSAYTLLIGIYFMSSMIGWFCVFHFLARSSSSSRAEHCKRTSKIASLAFIFTMKYIVPWSTQMAPESHEFGNHKMAYMDLMEFLRPSAGSRFLGKHLKRCNNKLPGLKVDLSTL